MLNSYCISSHNHVYVMYIIARWEVPRKSNFDSHPCDFFPLSQQSAFLMHFFWKLPIRKTSGVLEASSPFPAHASHCKPPRRAWSRGGRCGLGAGPQRPPAALPNTFLTFSAKRSPTVTKTNQCHFLDERFYLKELPTFAGCLLFRPHFPFSFWRQMGFDTAAGRCFAGWSKEVRCQPKREAGVRCDYYPKLQSPTYDMG